MKSIARMGKWLACLFCCGGLGLPGVITPHLQASDWPTFQANYARNGRTTETLPADEQLNAVWTYQSPHPPQPAWSQPAKYDTYHWIRGLKSMRNYDPVFHVIVAGDSLYFGSSLDESVHCLNAHSGETRWTYTTDGPVRVAPSYFAGRLYFGSDDGFAYCLEAQTGSLIWRYSPQPDQRRVLNNGRLISFWPVRTGLIVDQRLACFGASMLPWKATYLCAVDAATGSPEGPGRYRRELANETMEGPLVASAQHLIAPQGRVAPRVYARATGESRGELAGPGGSFVLLTDDDQVIHGPGSRSGQMAASSLASRTQLASFDRGNAIIVIGEIAYILTDSALMALERPTKKVIWSVPCGHPHALILAGDILFAGGTDSVAAFRTSDGRRIWDRKAHGRVYGLAVAGGALYASTDEGAIHCFKRAPEAAPAKPLATKSAQAGGQAPGPGWTQVQFDSSGDSAATGAGFASGKLTQRWVMHRSKFHTGKTEQPTWPLREAWVQEAGPAALSGQVPGIAETVRVGDLFALQLDGGANCIRILDDYRDAPLPSLALTIEAWIRIDRAQPKAAIGGVFHDEKGWMLGFASNVFTFAVAGKQQGRPAHYLRGQAAFAPGEWYHVAGTYDGVTQKLFVNGRLQSTATAVAGPIDYPARAPYDIGVYHEGEKEYFIKGQLHSVTVRDRALDEKTVAAIYENAAGRFYPPVEVQSGPTLRFTGRQQAAVRWTTDRPAPSVLEYDLDGTTWRYEEPSLKTAHEVILNGLKRDRNYYYAILAPRGGRPGFTKEFLCDTYFNYTPPAMADNSAQSFKNEPQAAALAQAAGEVLRHSGVNNGIAVVAGLYDGSLIYQLCRQSQLRVIAFDTDRARIQAARTAFLQAGLYGSRVSILPVSDLAHLPAPGHFANLALSESMILKGENSVAVGELHRMLKPGDGVALFGQPAELLGRQTSAWLTKAFQEAKLDYEVVGTRGFWAKVTRPELPGAGAWTHQYGNADNSAFGGEALLGARHVDELEVQWLGEPGPRYQEDREGRNASPLAVNGKLFCQGQERILAVDAGNGTVLWSLETPEFMRFNVPRDSANWCADQKSLYLAIRDQCWRIDQNTGDIQARLPVINGPRKDWQYDWGFIARQEQRLLGSAVKKGTALKDFWGGVGWYDASGGPAAAKVCSDNLFALYPDSGERAWTYQHGLILNSTISVADGRVFFVEARHQEILDAPERWIHKPEMWKDLCLVALDLNTGSKLYEHPLEVAPGDAVFYLAAGRGKLVLVSSNRAETKYFIYAFAAGTGDFLWQTDLRWPGGDHGAHMSRPAIVGSRLYVRPRVFDLNTGALIEGIAMLGGGCGTYAATGNTFFFRSGNITMWDADQSKYSYWSRLRPDCWLSTVPALGMVLSPEGGGGCSCGTWMETSVAFMPDRQQSRLIAAMERQERTAPVAGLITAASAASDLGTRVAAIRTLGSPRYGEEAGDATPLLLRKAAAGAAEEQTAARDVLRLIDSPRPTPTLLAALADQDRQIRLEAIAALGDRGEREAYPQLLKASGDPDPAIRLAALKALPQVSLAPDYTKLISLIDEARTDEERQAAARGVLIAARRFVRLDDMTRPLGAALENQSSVATKTNLLRMLGRLGGSVAFNAVRGVCSDPDDTIREAAWNTWPHWPDASAFTALLEIAGSTPHSDYRTRALEGALHVLALPGEKRDPPALLQAHQAAMAVASQPPQQRLVLASLAKSRDLDSLNYALSLLDNAAIRKDAALALLPIAQAVSDAAPTNALAAVLAVRRQIPEPEVLLESGKVLDHIQRFDDFIVTWQIAGPYAQPSTGRSNLIQWAFAPEDGASNNVPWQSWTAEIRPQTQGILNLRQKFPETNSCLYLQTRVFAPRAGEIALLIGSDESYKLWVNSQLTQEKLLEKPRGMRPNEDRIPVALRQGWNVLRVKTVRTEGGWSLSCRLRELDGSPIDGIKVLAE